jgi:F0F1-type ATP synthase assembly protein I
MGERTSAPTDDPVAEAVATTGLFLMLTAVIAVAVCLAGWGASDGPFAAVAGVIGLLSFAVSIACFRAQADEHQPQEVAVR